MWRYRGRLPWDHLWFLPKSRLGRRTNAINAPLVAAISTD
jgi:hypothetical protein